MAMTLLETNSDSTDVTTVNFTSTIDSTYKLFIFKFLDINPATDGSVFVFNGSIDGGSTYSVTKNTTFYNSYHHEDDSSAALSYSAGNDMASETAGSDDAFQYLTTSIGNGADESCAGTLWLFNPSSTTYVKHFYSRFNVMKDNDASWDCFMSGYFNDTNDIDGIQFKMDSGNFDSIIKLYGVG